MSTGYPNPELPLSIGYDPRRDGVTASLLQNWLECRKRGSLYLQRFTPYHISDSLQFGTLVHNILQKIYSDPRLRKWEYYTKIIDKIITASKDSSWEKLSANQRQDFELMEIQIHALIPEYVRFWYKKDFATELEWIHVEEVFKQQFGPVPLRGRMDAVFLRKGMPWLFETKTSSQISEENLMSTLGLNLQINIYVLVLEKILRKLKIMHRLRGVLYNIIRRPGLKLKKGERLKDLGNRIREHIRKDPEHYFKRFEVVLDHGHIDDFRNELQDIVWDFYRWWLGRMNSGIGFGMPCINKFGLCKFVPICHDGDYSPFYKRKVIFEELEN